MKLLFFMGTYLAPNDIGRGTGLSPLAFFCITKGNTKKELKQRLYPSCKTKFGKERIICLNGLKIKILQ